MPTINTDELQTALQAVSDTQKAWESALRKLNQLDVDVDVAEHDRLMTDVGDAEKAYFRSACYLAYRVQTLVKCAIAGAPPISQVTPLYPKDSSH